MAECYYLWQEGLVCKEAVRSQQGVAQLERRPERPHVDDEVPEALPELETLEDPQEHRVVPAEDDLQQARRPPLVLREAGRPSGRRAAEERRRVGVQKRRPPAGGVDPLPRQDVLRHRPVDPADLQRHGDEEKPRRVLQDAVKVDSGKYLLAPTRASLVAAGGNFFRHVDAAREICRWGCCGEHLS